MFASQRGQYPPMDRVTTGLLAGFSKEHEIEELDEAKRFEHFATYVAVGRHHGETFETGDLLTGTALGIDAIAILVNGTLVTDSKELQDLAARSDYLEATFIFAQADRSSAFEVGKLGNFAFAVRDFFSETPSLRRNDAIAQAA